MMLLDTNILIEILKGDDKTISFVESYEKELFISSITQMELYFGAINKAEVKKIEKFLTIFTTIHVDNNISKTATNLIKNYSKSHNLDIPDALIASTALEKNLGLFTYNVKDFKYIKNLELLS